MSQSLIGNVIHRSTHEDRITEIRSSQSLIGNVIHYKKRRIVI